MELKRTDSSLAQALKTVGWNSATFRAYLSFVEDEEVNIRLILMNRSGESSEEEAEVDVADEQGPEDISPEGEDSSSISSTSESI